MKQSIAIGSATLALTVPADLDQRLLVQTGCSPREVEGLLDGFCMAGFIAHALVPLLVDPQPVGDLAPQIHAAGTDQVRRQLLALYRAINKPAKAKTKGKATDGAQAEE